MKSDPPHSSSSSIKGSISIPKNFIPWKVIIAGTIIFLGGGGLGLKGDDLLNGYDNKKPQYFVEHCEEQAQQVEKLEKADEKLDSGIKILGDEVKEIKTIQVKDISRREARRAVESFKGSPQKKAEKFIQIYEKNIQRLDRKKPKEPCSDWRCNN
jgi:hypothetical protein